MANTASLACAIEANVLANEAMNGNISAAVAAIGGPINKVYAAANLVYGKESHSAAALPASPNPIGVDECQTFGDPTLTKAQVIALRAVVSSSSQGSLDRVTVFASDATPSAPSSSEVNCLLGVTTC